MPNRTVQRWGLAALALLLGAVALFGAWPRLASRGSWHVDSSHQAAAADASGTHTRGVDPCLHDVRCTAAPATSSAETATLLLGTLAAVAAIVSAQRSERLRAAGRRARALLIAVDLDRPPRLSV